MKEDGDDQELKDLSPWKGRALSAAEGVAAMIPIVNVLAKISADEVRSYYFLRFRKRMDRQFEEMKARVSDVELRVSESLLRSDEFLDFHRASCDLLGKTSRKEKLQAAQNLYLHHLADGGESLDVDEAVLAFIDATPASYLGIFIEVVRVGGVRQHHADRKTSGSTQSSLAGYTSREPFPICDDQLIPILLFLSGQGVLLDKSVHTGFVTLRYDVSAWGETVAKRIIEPDWIR